MWTYPACLSILIPGGLQPIAPCPPPLPGGRAVITILRSWLREPHYQSFHSSHAPALTISSIVGPLAGFSEGRFAQHWSDS